MQILCPRTCSCCRADPPPSPARGETSGVFLCVLPWRRLALLLVACVVVFVFQQMWLWDMWSCEECLHVQGCTEVVYQFDRPSWFQSIYDDRDLLTKCGALDSSSADKSWTSTNATSMGGNSPPKIHTKCGSVSATPLNPWQRNPSSRIAPANNSVPNIVHYISFGSREFSFLNYMSFLSVHKFLSPSFIYVHGDATPYGYWWNRTLHDVSQLYFVPRMRPLRVQGYKMPWIEHSSDLLRLQTLFDNGGIYLDTDILVLRPFTPLMGYETVLGRETSFGLGSGIILARPHAPFVCMWRQGYRTYVPWPWNWANYAVWTPNKLAKAIPDHIHVEADTLHRPNFEETDLMFRGHYDWSRSYAMHIWKRYGHVPQSPEEIKHLDSTLGEVMRHIYYGNSEIMSP